MNADTYTAPIADMRFVLTHLVDLHRVLDLPGLRDCSADVVDAVLQQAGRFASEVFAPLNVVGDRIGAQLDKHRVRMPPGFREAYRKYIDAGWCSLSVETEHGGQGLPRVVSSAVGEMWKSANLAFSANLMLTTGAMEALIAHASTDQLKRYLPRMLTGEWTGAMNLTEPQAGSDLSVIRTRAVPQADGKYRLHGQKCFITYADHDMADNVVHLVLARLPDAPAGVKGISLFLLANRQVQADGSLGPQNDVKVLALEKKLGQHASPTCVLMHGESEGALGELVGAPGAGLTCMFVMMNDARLQVALEGVGVGERAYQHALAYARLRVQGRAAGTAAPAAIAQHPDVRRMLMWMKAQNEAMRAVAYVAASWLDIAKRDPSTEQRREYQDRVDLMIPVLKGWMTETGAEVACLGIQIHGGAGFVEETGAAQFYRDVRASSIYEGTTGIQASDLIGRKLGRTPGPEAIRGLLREMRATAQELANPRGADIVAVRGSLLSVIEALSSSTEAIIACAADEPQGVLAVSVPFLKLVGIAMGAWQMARAAGVAERLLSSGEGDSSFLREKIATARFYAEHISPQAGALAVTVEAGRSSPLAIDFCA
ncbi:acyl-CoA dehydrogenase [Aquincola sp. S2]|uniref:Acyl-CoA dehydrogenase n=1 Tax=Pseudaquabacterium terrae TaxID=2732868 RepID=A0ABX2ERS2_9BURK|nr:acyl-CoA dehydrogenase [Aquabacterium terrae]NRF71337.1 acyl-CoA dehydrogenase [Aquabacterium terrae]